MASSSILLWPRQEVLQLVIPQLGLPPVGNLNSRGLTNSTATKVIRKLVKHQNIDGKISFDKWLLTAKEIMKWNDSCIQLFWEMLLSATFYLTYSSSTAKDSVSQHDIPNKSSHGTAAQSGIDLEYLAIFLVLHVNDVQQRSSSPIVAYDTIWPANHQSALETDYIPTSPSSSPPSSHNNKQQKQKHSNSIPSLTSSPKSPKPQSSPSNVNSGTSSPKRFNSGSSRTPTRSTTNYLHLVRQKIPIILKALCDDAELFDANMPLSPTASFSRSNSFHSNSGSDGSASRSNSFERDFASSMVGEFSVTRKAVDALGLIICGGQSRDQHISSISMLHPFWSGESNIEISQLRTSRDIDFPIDSSPTQIYFSELSAWIDLHLSMNDLLYPVSVVPNYASMSANSPTSFRDFGDMGENAKAQQSTRQLSTLSSLSRFNPTVINNCSVTIQHMVTTGLSRSMSGIRRSRSSSQENCALKTKGKNTSATAATTSVSDAANLLAGEFKLATQISGVSNSITEETNTVATAEDSIHDIGRFLNNQDERMDYNTDSSVEAVHKVEDDSDFAKYDLRNDAKFKEAFFVENGMQQVGVAQGGTRPDLTLPQLFVNYSNKGKLYMLSPYYSASINGCSDCEIVIGSVFGAVIVSGCERVRLTVACRKLIVMNCLECEFNLATLSSTILMGDCRAIVFGPYNTSFRNLKNHLKMSLLHDLINSSIPFDFSAKNPNNLWATIWDVNSCLEASNGVGSPAGYAIDIGCSPSSVSMPLFPSSTASILAPEKFRPISIPAKQEHMPFEASVIAVEAEYVEHVRQQEENLRQLKQQVEYLLREMGSTGGAATAAATAAATSGLGADGSNLNPPEEEEGAESSSSILLASSVIAKKFTEWLVSSEHIHEVFDLIRIDSDRQIVFHQ